MTPENDGSVGIGLYTLSVGTIGRFSIRGSCASLRLQLGSDFTRNFELVAIASGVTGVAGFKTPLG
jgi:hypothetical protein